MSVTTLAVGSIGIFGRAVRGWLRRGGPEAGGRRPQASIRLQDLEARLAPATVQGFDGGGSAYVLHAYGAPPPDDTVPGPTGNLLRLASGVAGSVGSITFAATDLEAYREVRVNFDFRMILINGRADGFGINLLNTDDAEYGAQPFVGGLAEEANYRDSLGIGFDIYSNGEVSNNHISVHFDEQEWAEVDVTPFGIDLASGNMIRAEITARFGVTATTGDVTVVLTPAGGNPTTVLNQFVVPNLLPYPARVHAMARSGGEAAHHDFDNFDVQYIGPDKGTFQLTAPTYTVVESQPTAVLKVIRTGGTLGQVTVTIATANGGAIAGQDYTALVPTVLTFANGETTKVINIPILNNTVAEPNETFTVTLSNATDGAQLGVPASATVTIFDVDDDPPAQVGAWSGVVPLPVVPIHQVALPTGEVLFWARHSPTSDGDPRVLNPVTGQVRLTPPLTYDIFCAGHTLMADGRVFVAGGHIADGDGENKASIYDPWAGTWTRVPDMNDGRWYPSVTLLPNGDLLVIGGTQDPGIVNALPQVYEVKENRWRDLTTALLGNFPEYPDFYPWATVAADGRVFIAGPQQTGRYLDTTGTGTWADAADSSLLYRDYGSAVEYSEGKVLIAGGKPRVADDADPGVLLPSATAEVIDFNAGAPAYQPVAPMTTGRRHLNLTVLPNDTVLATGGSSAPGFQDLLGAVLYPESWNPVSNTWTPQAAHAFPLLYHSNAMLLPTAQVLVTGGGQPAPAGGQDEPKAQVFSPPYLFQGLRPAIGAAPAAVHYGESFAVATSTPAGIAKVTLIPLPSPTHAFNENQGIEHLAFTTTGTGVTATTPATPNLAPPGFYYLFVVNSAGIPSIAKLIQLGTGVTVNPAATQADPASGPEVVFDVVFDAPVTGFDPADVDLSASTVGGTLVAAVAGSGAAYTVTVTGMTGTGTVVARVRAKAAVDQFGIETLAPTGGDDTVVYDGVAPTVTVEQAAGQADPTATGPIRFTVRFSEPVFNFVGADVDLSASTVLGPPTATVTGSGADYTVEVTGMTGTGTVEVRIPDGAAEDVAGNGNTPSTGTDNKVDFSSAGTVSFVSAVYHADEEGGAFTVTVTRAGEAVGAIDVDYATVLGTAVEGLDYTAPTPDKLSWGPGQTGDRSFDVSITDDLRNEGAETIGLRLSNPTGGALLGTKDATLIIRPSDGTAIPGTDKKLQATVTDGDGDLITIKLSRLKAETTGLLFFRTDLDGNGEGPIELIRLTDSTVNTAVTITVKKPTGGTGDGKTTLAELTGTHLKGLSARAVDLIGPGITLTGNLGAVTVADIKNGADITAGPAAAKSRLRTGVTAGVIADGTTIDVGTPLTRLTAIAVGDGAVVAPSVGTILVKGKPAVKKAGVIITPAIPGDFKSDVTISGAAVAANRSALSSFRATGAVTGSSMLVMGNVGSFSALKFDSSRLFAGYNGLDNGSGMFSPASFGTIGSFKVLGLTEAFRNSHVIATVMRPVFLRSVDFDNDNVPFGFIARDFISRLTVGLPPPVFTYVPADGDVKIMVDFHVRIL